MNLSRALKMDLASSSRGRVINMPTFEDTFEDIPPVLPPLQDFANTTMLFSRERPSPLEPRPNNRVNVQAQTTTLSNRQKALAEAKPIENGDTEIDPRLLVPSVGNGEMGEQAQLLAPPDPEQARKKAKLRHNEQIADFVHLPTPQLPRKNLKEDRLPPLRPIAELNEPPSGAARFPPITPRSTSQPNESNREPDQFQQLPKLLPKEASKSSRRASVKRVAPQVKKQRIYTRERTKWTEEETEQLVQGLAIYGMGRWKHILDHPEFHFHPSRTHVDLKDRCRVLFPPHEPHKWVRPMPEHVSDDENQKLQTKKPGDKPKLRKRKQAWTEHEDRELEKGFQKHGYQWKRIAKDESLHFDKRSGSNIRDRFRLRFPEKWAEPRPPQPIPSIPRRAPGGTKGVGSRGGKGQRKNKKRKGNLDPDGSMQRSLHETQDNVEGLANKGIAPGKTMTKDTTQGQSQGQAQVSDWLNDLLNEDWDGPAGGISLPPPPVRWEDMAVQTPMFDIA